MGGRARDVHEEVRPVHYQAAGRRELRRHEAVLAKENKFKLLNTYWRNSPKDFAQQTDTSEELLDAAADGNRAKVQTLYAKYMQKSELQTFANLPPAKNYHMTNRDASMSTR